MPKWLPAFAAISITVMVCLTVNFRAFSELREETDQNKTLNAEIEKIREISKNTLKKIE